MNRKWAPAVLSLSVLLFGACSDGGGIVGSGDPVTITGKVFNTDTLTGAEGVAVYLLDNEDTYISEPTGPDGLYSITVPSGSQFLLTTDDADNPGSTEGDWYPLINVETWATPTITENLDGWPIHACPNPSISPNGSLQAYNDYLADSTVAGDFFGTMQDVNDPNSGIIYVTSAWIDNDAFDSGAGITADFGTTSFPTGYLNLAGATDVNTCLGVCTAAPEAPNVLQADGGTSTDESASFMSIGDPAFTGTSVSMTFTPDPDHVHEIPVQPFEIPVRPNHLSDIIAVDIDGTGPNTVKELFQFFGLL